MWSSHSTVAYKTQTWWPVLLATTFIFLESTASMGANHTAGPLHQLLVFLFGPLPDSTFNFLHFMARKSGHFIGYGLIGLVWMRAGWRSFQPEILWLATLCGLLGAFFTACADELHQCYLPNREGSFHDVLLDTAGALALISLTLLVLRKRSKAATSR